MDTPIHDPAYSAPVDAPTRQMPVRPGTDEAPAPTLPAGETPFDTGKAVRYSVANFGASNFYMLFNTAMPLYLDSYGVRPEWIGLLANERSFVGALVQPVVGRISDRTR